MGIKGNFKRIVPIIFSVFLNFSIRIKLLVSFLIISALIVVVGMVGFFATNEISKAKNDISKSSLPKIEALLTIKECQTAIILNEKNIISSKDEATTSSLYNEYNIILERMDLALSNYEKLSQDENVKQWQYFEGEWGKWNENILEFMRISKERDKLFAKSVDNIDAINKYNAELNFIAFQSRDTVIYLLDSIIKSNQTWVDKAVSKSDDIQRNSIFWVFFVCLITLIIAIILGIILERIIAEPIRHLTKASEKLAVGDINVDISSNSKDEIGMLMLSFQKMVDNIKEQSLISESIAQGNLNVQIIERSEMDIDSKSMKQIIHTIKNLIEELELITISALAGKLDARADSTKFNGEFNNLIVSFNKTLDAVITPLKSTASYVHRISNGDIPPKLSDNYEGDFKYISESINVCIDSINMLVEDIDMLVVAGVEGKLATRADASNHKGSFASIVNGINRTLDAFIEPVSEASDVLSEIAKGNLKIRVVKDYNGDHAIIKNSLNDTLDNLHAMISETTYILSELSRGNFDVSINSMFKGDFAEIRNALEFIILNINNIMLENAIVSEQVSAGAEQISEMSSSLSQGATEQAASIEQLNASIMDIAFQTKDNAVNSNIANDLSLKVKNDAEKGNYEMNKMLISMDEINQSSNEISKIIKVIDGIAFQTNLLALNAAVEAARAGQHGRGFAVVADEVRNLAIRCAESARETSSLIEDSVEKINNGIQIAHRTANNLKEIISGVTKTSEINSEIAKASNVQVCGISQISQGIDQVGKVVQHNSALSEESASSSLELTFHANTLKESFKKFKFKI